MGLAGGGGQRSVEGEVTLQAEGRAGNREGHSWQREWLMQGLQVQGDGNSWGRRKVGPA